jgi:hypothetical protein
MFQSVMCLFCRDGQRRMYGGLLSARILLLSTRKALHFGVDLSLARKWDSRMLVYNSLISHHVKSMCPVYISNGSSSGNGFISVWYSQLHRNEPIDIMKYLLIPI